MLLTREPEGEGDAKWALFSKEHAKRDGVVTNPFTREAHKVNETKQGEGKNRLGKRENDPSEYILRLPIYQGVQTPNEKRLDARKCRTR